MLQALAAILIILIIAMIVCVLIVNKKKIKNSKTILQLITMAIFTSGCYTTFILLPFDHETLATFVGGLYYLSTDWLAIYLMFFAADYTQIQPPSKMPRRVVGFIAGIDSISFVVNTFTHHMFDLDIGIVEDLGLEYWKMQFTSLYMVHLLFAYMVVLYSLCILAYRLFTAPAIYKGKYNSIFVLTAGVIVLNLVCTISDAKFDYSVTLYGFLAMSICYFVLYASPKKTLVQMHSAIVGESVIGLFAYDNYGRCVGVNQKAKELFESDEDINIVAEQYLARWKEEYQGKLADFMHADRTIRKNGEKIYLHVDYQRLLDKKGKLLGSSFQFEDRTEVVKHLQEEEYKATHDMLTGLLNRSAFEEEAMKILAEADEPYCMVCSNIMDFKLINEMYGSDVGDELLIAQADLIRREERGKSITARIYADQFCTLLPKSHYDEQRFIESLSSVMENSLEVSLKPHFHFGIYDIADVTEPIWTMYDKTVMAIDAIRGNYGQYTSYYKEEMLQHIMREKEVVSEFDKALEENQFQMFLQPQIANSGTIVGAEALVRWIHPEKGLINPGMFISVLEKAGLIHRLDAYMWETAAKKLAEWKNVGKEHLSISVNISAKDFYFFDVYEVFRSLAEKYEFNIKNLKIEITESVLMRNTEKIMKILDRLHELGYDIEIDDFGSGYSSLGMLKDIRADILKIDMIFLQETRNVGRSTTILKNIISMSKELGMPVITEGVETKEQVDFLMDMGCDMFQGFYFAKPMSVGDFEKEYFEKG